MSALALLSKPTADNPYFNSKYIPLQVVMDSLKEPLQENGISYTFAVTRADNGYEVSIIIIDIESGNTETLGVFPITELSPQKIGSVISYARRYLLMSVFNIAPEYDDDGNEASGNKPTLPKKKPVTLQTKQQAKTIDDINDEVPSFFD